MEKEQLQASLAELHNELAQVDNLDPTTRTMLVSVMEDIVKVLRADQRTATEEAAEDEEPSPAHGSESLRNMVAEFEAEHPQLARTIGQIADGLASIGI